MPIIKKITILNETTLRLDQSANPGDIVDLKQINQVDLTLLQEQITSARDQEYQKRLETLQREWESRQETAILRVEQAYLGKINALTLQHQANQHQLETKLSSLETEKQGIKSQLRAQLDLEMEKKQSLYEKEVQRLKGELLNLQHEIKIMETKQGYELKGALQEEEQKWKDQLQQKQLELEKLTLTRSLLNVKKQGEHLELWCNNQFEQYAQNGFAQCTWEKDNAVIKTDFEDRGTKADYLFRVYASDQHQDSELLSSVVCEMKSEDPSSTYRKKNADYYKKLDLDRKKKQGEYALLISELEWEQDNDLPIRKVKEYENMYVVRPQYFVAFLSVVTSLAVKYRDLILNRRMEETQFQESQTILDQFNDMKKNILDINLVKVEKQVTLLRSNTDQLRKIADSNEEAINKIYAEVMENIKRKIEQFNIQKITKKIDRLQ